MNLQTANGEVAKRAYDLVVIPEERASIGSGSAGLDKGDSRGKRNRSTKGQVGNAGNMERRRVCSVVNVVVLHVLCSVCIMLSCF